MKALGVPPLIAYLRGETDLHTAVETAKRDSRRYAKRQLTWFRNQTASWPRIVLARSGSGAGRTRRHSGRGGLTCIQAP